MEYSPVRVTDIIRKVNQDTYLPAIQREFVWDTDHIERLFDSIMSDFPIGSFLYWRLEEKNKNEWPIYEFIREFDKESPHNPPANMTGIMKDITLVLDGQQRITSLFIGLRGSFRHFHYRWKKTRLYLNLLKQPVPDEENPEELTYAFAFLEGAEPDANNSQLWYLVGRILDFEEAEDAKSDMKGQLAAVARRSAGECQQNDRAFAQSYPYDAGRQLLRGEVPGLRQGVADVRAGEFSRGTPFIR